MKKRAHDFESRAVGFVDVLGFKSLVQSAEQGNQEALQSLNNLSATLNAHVRFSNQAVTAPKAVQPRYLMMSDSIVLSSPETYRDAKTGLNYDGIAIICAKVIQLSHTLLEGGTLVRGAVHVGPVKLDPRNIFGTGYMQANLHEHIAWTPRVVLTKEAHAAYQKVGNKYGRLALADGAEFIVNLLDPAYSKAMDGNIYEEDLMEQYRAHIVRNLKLRKKYRSAWTHWAWMASYFNEARIRNSHHSYAPIALPPAWKIALAGHRLKHVPMGLYAKIEISKMKGRSDN